MTIVCNVVQFGRKVTLYPSAFDTMWKVDTEVSEQHVACFWTVTELHLSSTEDTKRRRLTPYTHYVKTQKTVLWSIPAAKAWKRILIDVLTFRRSVLLPSSGECKILCSFETLVTVYRTARYHVQNDCNAHIHLQEGVKSATSEYSPTRNAPVTCDF